MSGRRGWAGGSEGPRHDGAPKELPSHAADEGLRMTMRTHVPHLLARTGTISVLALATLSGTSLLPGTATDAAAASVPAKAVRIAASKKGAPYRYGAQGPYTFD